MEKYDISQAISATPEIPIYLPETRLTLHGQVTSFLRNKEQKDISVSVIARRDTISGSRYYGHRLFGILPHSNDDLQWFHECGYSNYAIKVKKLNRKTNISLFRNFTPELRKYAYEELHPKWEDISGLSWWSSLSDSLYLDSIMGHDTHLLNQVTIKAKRTKYEKNSSISSNL